MTVGQAVDDAGNDKNDDEDDINVDVIGSRQQFLQVRTGTKYYKRLFCYGRLWYNLIFILY